MAVYPRACGGTPLTGRSTTSRSGLSPRLRGNPLPSSVEADRVPGLSPRLRGNPLQALDHHLDGGSIPAPAGEPLFKLFRHRTHRVYPRACGGTLQPTARPAPGRGLSPRLRGNPGLPDEPRPRPRSIPAPAGEPIATTRASTTPTVYPRACGGTGDSDHTLGCFEGLSPRLRGNPPVVRSMVKSVGSIPAPAGEPWMVTPGISLSTVYPRACGGTALICTSGIWPYGLSPRLRGNHVRLEQQLRTQRSIPAPAGEPDDRRGAAPAEPVYPRACGGTAAPAAVSPNRRGLSPRLRGNLHLRIPRPVALGSIPAPAGEPPRKTPARRLSRVYPRACGEPAT